MVDPIPFKHNSYYYKQRRKEYKVHKAVLRYLPPLRLCVKLHKPKRIIKLEETKQDAMIKISGLREGDFVMVNNEGTEMEAMILEIDNTQQLTLAEPAGGQAFWYEPKNINPIPLSGAALKKIHFQREDQPDGSVKYLKGAFRLQIARSDDFNHLSFWYREDIRQVHQPIALHQLQNYYLQMTKVQLTGEAI